MMEDLTTLFGSIRDIPYRIPLSLEEEDCACVGKNQKLMNALQELGYEVRWRICDFRWSDLPIPKNVLVIPHDDEAQHAYLEVKLEGEWKTVDATWDAGLHRVLDVADWDGLSATPIAVPCSATLSPEESAKLMSAIDTEAIQHDLGRNGEFYKALNDWLDKVRSKS